MPIVPADRNTAALGQIASCQCTALLMFCPFCPLQRINEDSCGPREQGDCWPSTRLALSPPTPLRGPRPRRGLRGSSHPPCRVESPLCSRRTVTSTPRLKLGSTYVCASSQAADLSVMGTDTLATLRRQFHGIFKILPDRMEIWSVISTLSIANCTV